MDGNKRIRQFTCAVLLLGSLAACREVEPVPPGGGDEPGTPAEPAKEVVFSASTMYDNGEGTRTEFSGVVVGGGTLNGSQEAVERIDWLVGDPVTILYQNGNSVTQADYAVASVAQPGADEPSSQAEIAPRSEGLVWGRADGHVFCAVYPSVGYGGTSASLVRDGQGQFIAGGAVPAAQLLSYRTVNGTGKYLPDMKHALMVAYREAQAAGGSVSLPFSPAVSTLEFAFKNAADDDSYLIRELRVHVGAGSVSGAYTLRVTGSGSNLTTWDNLSVGSGGADLTLTFDSDGDGTADDVQLDSEVETSFTAFTVPAVLTEVTLQLVYANGTVRSLPLRTSGVWETFQPGRKYKITNYKVPAAVGGWSYIVEEIPDYACTGHAAVSGIARTVGSYRFSALHPGTKEAVPWKLQYSADGTSWADVSGTGALPGTDFTVSALSGTGFTLGITGTSTATTGQQSIAAADAAEMAARTPYASGNGWFDLSTHPSWGLLGENAPAQTARNTANCYVVSRPGNYEFPCVYGNAITDGATNYASFAPGDANSAVKGIESKVAEGNVHWITHFRGASNAAVTNPWIVADLSATGLSADILAGSDIVSGASVVDGTGGKYIRFSIASGSIRPGNVVIALKGTIPGRSGSEILWSWHIWVTNKDLTPVTIGGRRMMDWNLGWADSPDAALAQYPDRSLRFRVVQTDGSGNILSGSDTEPFTVTQEGDAAYTSANKGSSPYYQWGRKDPLSSDAALAVLQYRSYDKYSVAATYDLYIESCEGLHVNDNPSIPAGYGRADFGYGIRNPRTAVCNSYTSGWVGGPVVPYKHWNVRYRYAGNSRDDFYEDIDPAAFTDNYCIYYWVPGTYTTHNPVNLNLSDFSFLGMFGYPDLPLSTYTEERKTETAVGSNLWNAYCWADSDFRSGSQVFKTIYDPCPPGYTVPSRGAFDQAGSPVDHTSGNTVDGVLLDGHFFPFTGVRSFSATQGGGAALAADVYHWTHTLSLNQRHPSSGYSWTAQREDVGIVTTGNVNREFSGFGGARILSYSSGSVSLPGSNSGVYTMGSAAPVRPMLDPRYAASAEGVTGGLEEVGYGTLPTE